MSETAFKTRSAGVGSSGVPDQYVGGVAAKVYELYVGAKEERTEAYRDFVVGLLRKNGCRRILDAACGTGVDSIMLLRAGFEVVSVDASDQMLKYALRKRWDAREDPAFDQWVIEEANWLTLEHDLTSANILKDGLFDAVLCIGDSFAHLVDEDPGRPQQRRALDNLKRVMAPGGLLLIDHRNYDNVLRTGHLPSVKNVYYEYTHVVSNKCYNLYVDGRPYITTLDHAVDTSALMSARRLNRLERLTAEERDQLRTARYRLSFQSLQLDAFTALLRQTFGRDAAHSVVGDFQPLRPDVTPLFYIHTVKKGKD